MLSFECAVCGEKKLIEPLNERIDKIENLVIHCVTCGYEGKPTFYISKCEGK